MSGPPILACAAVFYLFRQTFYPAEPRMSGQYMSPEGRDLLVLLLREVMERHGVSPRGTLADWSSWFEWMMEQRRVGFDHQVNQATVALLLSLSSSSTLLFQAESLYRDEAHLSFFRDFLASGYEYGLPLGYINRLSVVDYMVQLQVSPDS